MSESDPVAVSPARETVSGERDRSTGFGETHAVLVRQPITPERRGDVRDVIAERRPADGGTEWLLSGGDVVTVSLFCHHDDAGDALIWYVETTEEWEEPATTVTDRVASAESGLDELVTGGATVYGADELAIHAHNPHRPGTPGTVDVVLVTVGLEPGPGTWLTRAITGLLDRLKGTWLGRKLQASSVEVLEEERMWTESIYVDDPARPTTVLWYMEAGDMNRVMNVYETTDNSVARWSEVVLNRIFETPMTLLGDPMDASDYELLCHETVAHRR